MRLGLLNREQMSGSLAEAFDAIIGQIQGGWNREHLSNGLHKTLNVQQYLSLGTRLVLQGVVTERATGLTTLNSHQWRVALREAAVVRLTPPGALSITGIPVLDTLTDGQILLLMNVSEFDITLMHGNSGSPEDHRLITPAGANMIVPALGGAALAWYDAISERWRVFPWQAGLLSGTNTGDQNIFQTVAVSGQTDIVAESTGDTLTFASGSVAVVLTTTAGSDTLTIDVIPMVGDSGAGGAEGLVPAPAAGDTALNKYLRASGAWSNLGIPLTTRKTATESVTSSTTLQNDDHLLQAILANEVWEVECALMVQGDAAGDFSWAFNVPAGASGWHGGHRLQEGATTPADTLNTSAVADLTDTGVLTAGLAGAANPVLILVKAVVVNGANAGTIQLRWAQRVSSGTATSVLINSILKATRIG